MSGEPGPADESDEEDGVSVHGRSNYPTPFPRERTLGSPGSDDSGPIIPGQHHGCTDPLSLFVTDFLTILMNILRFYQIAASNPTPQL